MSKKFQIIPITISILVFFILCIVLFIEVKLINGFLSKRQDSSIFLNLNWESIILGFSIYIKTSIDFAIFIGHLIEKNITLRSRIAIEIGTSFGNALGTMLILLVWVLFKQIPILLGIMVILASLVLLELAESNLEHIEDSFPKTHKLLQRIFHILNPLFHPLLSIILPQIKLPSKREYKFIPLFLFAFTIPFILGLDDFAGYVSVFNTATIFSFAIGVFLGHLILNIAIFANPYLTIRIVKNKWISLIGTFVFIILAVLGILDFFNILVTLLLNK